MASPAVRTDLALMGRVYDRRAFRRMSKAIRGMPCVWCGRPATDLDHIEALADGGAGLLPHNLAPSCSQCNGKRGHAVGMRKRRGLGSHSQRW